MTNSDCEDYMEAQHRTRGTGLDHLRALAAFLVFSWHFTHHVKGYPVPFDGAPSLFFLSVFDEGHTGVALFMTLSGYLFAKILDGHNVNYLAFLTRRALRLLPLLVVVALIVCLQRYMRGLDWMSYLRSLPNGLIEPTLPNGGWSLTVEFHFYLALPFLLYVCRRSPLLLAAMLLVAVAFRIFLFVRNGTVFWPAYWTIVGRIDQFILGILAFHYRSSISKKHFLVAAAGACFCLYYWYFDRIGGLNKLSNSPLWIVIPATEGAFYGALIAYYDTSFMHSRNLISTFVAKVGEYSYSMYLLHFFVVFKISDHIHRHIMDISYYYTAQAWALLCFIALVPFTFITYHIFEKPFMRIGPTYIPQAGTSAAPAADSLRSS